MTAKEIGNFLGVSANTIKSRLQRARERLRAQNKDTLVREILGSVQFPADLTENIIRQIADLKPAPAPATKPLLPWSAFGATALLLVLFLGLSNQYLARFQKPYSFEAQSEPTVEIVDTPITLHLLSKPAVRNQVGHTTTPNKNIGTGIRATETTAVSADNSGFPCYILDCTVDTDAGTSRRFHIRPLCDISKDALRAFVNRGLQINGGCDCVDTRKC